MPKSIAIVTPVFPPYRGGIGKVAEQDAMQLAALGFAVHVYAPALPKVPGTSAEAAGGVTVHRLTPWLRYGHGAFVPQVAGLLKKHDLTVLHYPFFGGAEPLWLARLVGGSGAWGARGGRSAGDTRGKLAVTYHMDVVGSGLLGAIMRWHTRHVMPRILAVADKVLVTSFDYARAGNVAPMLAADARKFAEMPPSVDVARFAPVANDVAALRQRYGIAADERVIVQVGGLDRPHYFKGVPVLLEALASPALADAAACGGRVRLVIVGDGDLRSSFERRATELGVAAAVTFAGSVSEAELADHYRLADVFAFPSTDKSEAFGIAALEAAACGVPTVASDLAGVRTVVRDGVNGRLVPPGDALALAAALAALLADDSARLAMGRAGRDLAVREYSEPSRAARWLSVTRGLGLLP